MADCVCWTCRLAFGGRADAWRWDSRKSAAETLPAAGINVKNYSRRALRSHAGCKHRGVIRFPFRQETRGWCAGPSFGIFAASHRRNSLRGEPDAPDRAPNPHAPVFCSPCSSPALPVPNGPRAGSSLPTPESVFGFPVGADYKLFTYDQSIDYFRKLAAASNRVQSDHGRQDGLRQDLDGRDHLVAGESRAARQDPRDQHAPRASRRAHRRRRRTPRARQGKVIVDISGGLHASEIAGSQHTPQVAYELLSRANEPEMKAILDNVVFFLWPSINPDGQDIVVNWCSARDASPGQRVEPMELYEKYIGHDNNRDSYMLNVVESRVIQRTWREWEPDIIYVQHQSSPFPTRIWIPPFADPVGFRVPPIMAREVNAIGTRIAEELDAHGKPGAVPQLETFDAWYPGYIDYMPMYQNIPAWWTETQGGNCATPRTTTVDSLPRDYRDLRPTSLYVSPWAEGKWGLRDAVDYMVTADIATLDYAAKFKDELLYNRYQSARNTIQQFRTSAPVRVRHSAGAARSASRPSSCCDAWRSWACASTSSTAT